MRRRVLALLVLPAVLLSACGSGPEPIRGVTGDMGCAEVAEVIEEAIERGQRFVARQESDAVLGDDLIFALSGAEERPECVEEGVRSRAAGLRATISGMGR